MTTPQLNTEQLIESFLDSAAHLVAAASAYEKHANPKWVDPRSGRQVAAKAGKSRTKAEMEQLGYQCVGAFHKHKFVLHLTRTKP